MSARIFDFECEDWGMMDYQSWQQRQEEVVSAVIKGASNRLIFSEHNPPTITIGDSTKSASFLFSQEDIKTLGVGIVRANDRHGDLTLHAPGLLTVTPIFNLNLLVRDLGAFYVQLNQIAIDLLKGYGIDAMTIAGQDGVFVGKDKIVSTGIGVRKWVTYFGLGINVNTDLSLFRFIRPCGKDVQMTSMSKVLNKPVNMDEVKERLILCFDREFNDMSNFVS